MTAPARAGLAAGGGSLDGLRSMVRSDPKGAVKEAAKQFEALFMQEIMKSMRSASMKSGMLENSGTEMATGLLDSQYAVQMSGQRGGLADAIARQLERQAGLPSSDGPAGGSGGTGATSGRATDGAPLRATHNWRSLSSLQSLQSLQSLPGAGAGAGADGRIASLYSAGESSAAASSGTERAQGFVRQHTQAAQAASAASGIPASFMLAQAAHETGWGRREIRAADGSNANNLFGIKAGGDWKGSTVTATTTEVYDGRAVKVEAKFRAYSSYDESFRDYARLISQSPRYGGVMNSLQSGAADGARFAQGLQKAGYATDPDYARKLGRVIDTTLRLQRQSV